MYDLARFSLKDMTECGAALRKLGDGATSLEETAGRTVRYLHEHLVDGQSGEPACVLVRLFKTHPFKGLEPGLKRYAKAILGDRPAPPTLKCITLMATAGLRPEWNERGKSTRYKAIPILGEPFAAQLPMFARLFVQFGLDIGTVLQPPSDLLVDYREKTYNVFYVPEAIGSPYIPVQEEFVARYGVKSALGFGALLPSGDLCAVIMFSRVSVTPDAAEMFRPLALCVKLALLPFDGKAVFAPLPSSRKGVRA
ncbi:MAG: hypothetical protein EPO64_07825 [Nitrospirae bacterium]|nr:MAG: hypothetical protein EPO64_07825 [Nitrospirota bacterium]